MKPVDAASALAQAPGGQDWLRFTGITKRFGAFAALRGIDLGIGKGEFVCLLGPSGCGKTTLLRILAGLETQDAGHLHLGERDISQLPPSARGYGIVFQSYALFPNLTAAENVGYGLRVDAARKRRRVDELLDLVGLPGSQARYPSQLSGGQQQRVALARALATSPSLLLLDEPLSALDAQVREHLRCELRELQHKLGVTTLMVTHDQEEALALADRVAVMRDGLIEQVGTPADVYSRPQTRFVAEFVGRANFLRVAVDARGALTVGDVKVGVAADRAMHGRSATLFSRPEDVRIDAPWQPDGRSLMAVVERVDFLGSVRRASLRLDAARESTLWADVATNTSDAPLVPGQRVAVTLPVDRPRFFAESMP
jgi:iron(III) transport system ATP-binding protein